MSFDVLGLSDALLRAVAEAGYEKPTPIQEKAIPQILMGRDVLGIAQTGTGKTAAFTLPIIDILSQGRARARMPRCLIIEPTRELAAQVADSFEKYGKYSELAMALLIGGVSFEKQEHILNRGADVLIATPGRLLDHFERGKVLLNGVDILVVDECDRMLDMGFIPDVESICRKITNRHQSLFFSATLAKEIKKLTDRFLENPKEITVAPPSTTAESVEQFFVRATARNKKKTLINIVEQQDIQNAIIFCNRKKDVDALAKSLDQTGMSVAALHGDLPQSLRMEVLGKFKNDQITFLVASDVAARGLDIPQVSHIFNYDVPNNPDDYVHRIGRTARAGRKGRAFTFVTPPETKYAEAIENTIKLKIADWTAGGGEAKRTEKKSVDKSEAPQPRHKKKKSGAKQTIHEKQDKSAENSGQKKKQSDSRAPEGGLGDDVPAFLMRSAVSSNSADKKSSRRKKRQ